MSTSSISRNTTHEACPICTNDYQPGELEDTRKVVELYCGHAYHIDCYSLVIRDFSKNRKPLSCSYCTKKFPVIPIFGPDLLKDRRCMDSFLETMRDGYAYDSTVKAAIDRIEVLSEQILQIFSACDFQDGNWEAAFSRLKALVENDCQTLGHQKGLVLRLLSQGCKQYVHLRGVDQEGRRWRGEALEAQDHGLLVGINNIPFRVSIAFLKRHDRQIELEDTQLMMKVLKEVAPKMGLEFSEELMDKTLIKKITECTYEISKQELESELRKVLYKTTASSMINRADRFDNSTVGIALNRLTGEVFREIASSFFRSAFS